MVPLNSFIFAILCQTTIEGVFDLNFAFKEVCVSSLTSFWTDLSPFRLFSTDCMSALTEFLVLMMVEYMWKYENIQQLALEMYKVTKGLAPTAISSLLMQFCKNRHTQSQSDFSVSQVNTICFGQNSVRYLGPLIRNSIPIALRNV